MRMFSRRSGPISEACVLRLTMDSNSTGNPIQAGAATISFSIFVTRRDFPARSDLCKTNLWRQVARDQPRKYSRKSSLTISAKLDGVGAAPQLWILADEQLSSGGRVSVPDHIPCFKRTS